MGGQYEWSVCVVSEQRVEMPLRVGADSSGWTVSSRRSGRHGRWVVSVGGQWVESEQGWTCLLGLGLTEVDGQCGLHGRWVVSVYPHLCSLSSVHTLVSVYSRQCLLSRVKVGAPDP